VMEIYQNTVGLLANQEAELLIQISTNRTPILCLAVQSIGWLDCFLRAINL
jgi:hypothetical protein